jgi:HD-GYP domain-containing protein (c-di-GMP phosphodiesterase class II)
MDRRKLLNFGKYAIIALTSLFTLYTIHFSTFGANLQELALIPVVLAGFLHSTTSAVAIAVFFSLYSFLSAKIIDGSILVVNLLHSFSLILVAVLTGGFASYLKSKNLRSSIEKKQLESLNKLSTNFFTSLEPAVVYDQFTRELRKLLATDAAMLLKVNDKQTVKVLAEENAEALLVDQFLQALLPVLNNIQEGQVAQIAAEELKHESPFRSFFAVPVIEDEYALLASKKNRKLTADEIKLLNSFLDEAHLALTGAKYYTLKEQQARLIKIIAELNKTAASLAETDELIRAAVRKVFEYTNADIVAFFVFKDERLSLSEYLARPEYNQPEKLQELERILSYKEHFKELYQQSTAILVSENHASNKSLKELLESTGAKMVSYLPVIINGKTAACIFAIFYKELLQEIKQEFLNSLTAEVSMVFYNSRLISQIKNLTLKTVEAIAAAFDATNPYTKGHSQKVAKYATEIAKTMGLGTKEVREIQYAALLHDMGRIFVDEDILNAPRKLTQKELEKIRKIPAISSRIFEHINFFSNIMPLIYFHKEHYDGSGYPDGLKGENIPLGSRIIHVAESYVAMTSDRPHRAAFSVLDAVEELRKNSGTQFDPKVVDALIKVLKKEYPALFVNVAV